MTLRADAVKDGRRGVADACSKLDRPFLDGGEHSVMLPGSGPLGHRPYLMVATLTREKWPRGQQPGGAKSREETPKRAAARDLAAVADRSATGAP